MTTISYMQIFENIPLGLVVIDMNGNIENINRYAKNLLGITDTPIKSNSIHRLLDSLPISNLFQTEHFEEAGGMKVGFDGKMWEIVATRIKEGEKILPKAIISFRDITGMENTAKKDDEKHDFINELSADIAHEIRNPLGSIELLASLLKKESNREKDVKRADQIMAAVKTVENAISRFIHRSKKDQLLFTNVNIHDLLKEIMLFSEKIIDDGGIFLSASYAEIEPVVECSADMMKQVFLYLILNALTVADRLDIITHYIEKSRVIEIHFIEKSGSDPKRNRSSIFNSLSCSKEDRWGLGLAIIHNIVDMYNGWMSIEYNQEIGVEFVLSFPLLPEKEFKHSMIFDPIKEKKETNEKN